MITKKISTGVQVIFTKNKDTDTLSIANSIGCLDINGNATSGTQIITYSLCNETGMALPCSIIQTPNLKTYVCNLESEFIFNGALSFVNELSKYGNNYSVNIDRISTKNVSVDSNTLVTDSNRRISFNTPQSQESDPVIGSFIAKMVTDNGRMLYPLTQKFTAISHSIGKANVLLTGYANLRDYLMLIKEPTRGIDNLKNKSINSDYNINLDNNKIIVKVTNVINGDINLDCVFSGRLDNLSTQSVSPYILLTVKPIILGTQQLPYNIIRFKTHSIFVSPLYFANSTILANLHGGVNLLA